jgi:hypothetical protein
VAAEVIGRRALNRALLERQLLLRRADVTALEAVGQLVGLQAQVPLDPYTALWSRLARFRPRELAELLVERRVVRVAAMRSTIHLLTAEDCLSLRPAMQPVLDAELARHREYAPMLAGVDLEPVLRAARGLLAERPLSGPELRAALAELFPGLDAAALAYACRNHLALVQVPPRGLWGLTARVTSTTAEAWLGRPLATEPPLDAIVLRYLGAFGPATVADVATWSRLTGLRKVVERLRPGLRSFRDEDGRELFDLPGAPRPDPDLPAPPRFLPEYDNALLSHADRSRIVPEERRAALRRAWAQGSGSVLEDGFLRGVWQLEHAGDRLSLVVGHAGRMSKRSAAAIEAEGRRLLRFIGDGKELGDVRLVAVD